MPDCLVVEIVVAFSLRLRATNLQDVGRGSSSALNRRKSALCTLRLGEHGHPVAYVGQTSILAQPPSQLYPTTPCKKRTAQRICTLGFYVPNNHSACGWNDRVTREW